jgi:hypothetical protein
LRRSGCQGAITPCPPQVKGAKNAATPVLVADDIGKRRSPSFRYRRTFGVKKGQGTSKKSRRDVVTV